ncbi:class I SAM-dependent methyltransferase [Mycobacterium sp. MUNTM1]
MRNEPSRTAMLIATGRAAHLLLNGSRALLQDWMAWPLLGPYAETNLELAHELFGERWADAATWIAARTRISEDWLTTSKAEQYVILGAGLDTFAWRQAGAIEVHEFDHPSTQGWKRERLEKLGGSEPATLTMTGVDFEEQRVAEALRTSSVDLTRPIFVNWVGVLPYLTPAAITETLAGLPPCAAAITYNLPESARDADLRAAAERVVRTVAALGEPFITLTTPQETADLLSTGGFRVVEDLGPQDVTARFGLSCRAAERIVLAYKSG